MKRRRCLAVNWKALEGAAHAKRQLSLRKNDRDLFTCSIKLCLHADYKKKEISAQKTKSNTLKKQSFSLDEGIGNEFVKWLCTCGGGKRKRGEADW